MTIQIQPLRGLMDDFKRATELVRRNGHPIDLDSLSRLDQMRRNEKPGANTGRAQTRLDHRACRSFAIRPRDVDYAKRALRIAQRCEHFLDPLQPELRRLDLITERVQEPHRFGITDHLFRRYNKRAVAIMAAVAIASFNSYSQTCVTCSVGITEQINAST